MDRLNLKYGTNPNQGHAALFSVEGPLPLQVLNGTPGYINILDALLGWQLVRELALATGLPSAASYKHASPAGAAVALSLSEEERAMYFVPDAHTLSEQATAFVRARGADRLSSFGDFIALSDTCDASTASAIGREVSDGVIAPSYTPEALAILKKKRKGSYVVLEIDRSYEPPKEEERTLFGLTLTQERNNLGIDNSLLSPIVTEAKKLPAEAALDLLVGMVTLKYTQSNSVCFTKRGQVIGIGAGQQSRIHCTRLAAEKADLWHLRQSEQVLQLPFAPTVSRNGRDNIIDQYLRGELSETEEHFTGAVAPFSKAAQTRYLATVSGVSLASDAFFPFRDNIDRAYQSGVRYVVQSGGSVRDSEVIAACDGYGMVMICNKVRLFLH
ncbi:MAG TPA: phosphoribosylaminoimidazolecarboxamide formyltransferase [Sphaerochaeta sp.]|nr:phosphoribosylaminoimidazolecarboxamide formyltransferase [Sphaerochaeta sp.]